MTSHIKTAIGLMSGTSMDGIDVAVLHTDGQSSVEFGPTLSISYEPEFRRSLSEALDKARSLTSADARIPELATLEIEITRRNVNAIEALHARFPGLGPIDVIGLHGQTVLHRPKQGFTVQLGDGRALANATNTPVVFDMRRNDMVFGGEGAPLVPIYHRALSHKLHRQTRDEGIAFVNIGGIANVTFIFGDDDPVAFDTGPGNVLVDQWVERHAGIPYDDGGRIASEGQVDEDALRAYLGASFFTKSTPKSLDRNDFTLDLLGNPELADGAATLAKLTALSIAHSAGHLHRSPKTWIVSGGGAHNAAIMRHLDIALPDAEVVRSTEYGFDSDMMEAQCWAYLAVRSVRGLPLTFPTTTGCEYPVTGGIFYDPKERFEQVEKKTG